MIRHLRASVLRVPVHELYKCAALTAIVVLLAINTYGVQKTKGVVVGTVSVEGSVEIDGGTVDVSGSTVTVDR